MPVTPNEYIAGPLWWEQHYDRIWQFLNMCDAQRIGFNGLKSAMVVSFTDIYYPRTITIIEENNG